MLLKGSSRKGFREILFFTPNFFNLKEVNSFPVTTVVALVTFFFFAAPSSLLHTPAHPCYQLNISPSPETQPLDLHISSCCVSACALSCDLHLQGVSRSQICLLWVMRLKEMHRQVEQSNMPSVFQLLNKSVHCISLKGVKCVFFCVCLWGYNPGFFSFEVFFFNFVFSLKNWYFRKCLRTKHMVRKTLCSMLTYFKIEGIKWLLWGCST